MTFGEKRKKGGKPKSPEETGGGYSCMVCMYICVCFACRRERLFDGHLKDEGGKVKRVCAR